MSRLRGLARLATTLLLALVGAVALIAVVIPFALGAQSFTVVTGSMRPALEPGALVVVKERPIREIRTGDIVTFQIRSGRPELATHRVVGVGMNTSGERLLITQGDANDTPDLSPVREVQLRGVVLYSVPFVGYVNAWATPGTKSLVVLACGAGILAYGLVVLLRGSARRRRIATASAGILAVVAVASTAVLSPAPAHADDPQDVLEVDVGAGWGAEDVVLDLGAEPLVPGDSREATVRFRNGGPTFARLVLSATWRGDRPGGIISLSADGRRLDQTGIEIDRMAPGATREVTLLFLFPASAEGATRSRLRATVTAVLVGEPSPSPSPSGTSPHPSAEPSASSAPLPSTGAEVPWAAIAAGGGLLALGALFALVGVIRRRRSSRSDELGTSRAAPPHDGR